MQRIKYIDIGKGIYKSKYTYTSLTTGANYIVFLDTQNMTFRIKNVLRNNNVVFGGKGITNLRVLKRNAKKALAKLGVQFDLEIRKID